MTCLPGHDDASDEPVCDGGRYNRGTLLSPMRTVSIRDLGDHPSRVMRETTATGEPALVTNRGRPVAVILPVDEDALEDWLLANAPEWVRSYEAGESEFKRGDTVSHNQVWAELG